MMQHLALLAQLQHQIHVVLVLEKAVQLKRANFTF
jgi:hypothetical protein